MRQKPSEHNKQKKEWLEIISFMVPYIHQGDTFFCAPEFTHKLLALQPLGNRKQNQVQSSEEIGFFEETRRKLLNSFLNSCEAREHSRIPSQERIFD